MTITPSSPVSPSYPSVSAPSSLTPSPSQGNESQKGVVHESPVRSNVTQTSSPSRGRIVRRKAIPIVLRKREKFSPTPCKDIKHIDTPPPLSPKYEFKQQFAFEELEAFSQRLIECTIKCLNANSPAKQQEEESNLYKTDSRLIDSLFIIPDEQNKVIQIVAESVKNEFSKSGRKVEQAAVAKIVSRLLHIVPVKESSGCHCIIM